MWAFFCLSNPISRRIKDHFLMVQSIMLGRHSIHSYEMYVLSTPREDQEDVWRCNATPPRHPPTRCCPRTAQHRCSRPAAAAPRYVNTPRHPLIHSLHDSSRLSAFFEIPSLPHTSARLLSGVVVLKYKDGSDTLANTHKASVYVIRP